MATNPSTCPSPQPPGFRLRLNPGYFWWETQRQFWLFTVYSKDEMADLGPKERSALKEMLKRELEAR